jgi:tryptophanyl-tRNA synthetase
MTESIVNIKDFEMNTSKKRVLTGSRPSGSPHIGNYFGAYQPLIELGLNYDHFFFLADFHACNELVKPGKMRQDSLELIAVMLACGLDPKKCTFFAQSAVPEVCELAWILGCVSPYGMMLRSVAFKDAQAKGTEVNMGVFNYPILMAADILLYDTNLVPVGKDQKQHIEMARDFAMRFNNTFGDALMILPEPLISEELPLVPGLDGEKMSKSKNNIISIFATDQEWKKQIMAIKTSSEGLADPKDPDVCNVFRLYCLFANPDEQNEMAENYRKGGYGFGHAKQALLEKVKLKFSTMRESYLEWIQRPDDLRDVILTGSKKARSIAQLKLNTIQEAIGLIGRPQ